MSMNGENKTEKNRPIFVLLVETVKLAGEQVVSVGVRIISKGVNTAFDIGMKQVTNLANILQATITQVATALAAAVATALAAEGMKQVKEKAEEQAAEADRESEAADADDERDDAAAEPSAEEAQRTAQEIVEELSRRDMERIAADLENLSDEDYAKLLEDVSNAVETGQSNPKSKSSGAASKLTQELTSGLLLGENFSERKDNLESVISSLGFDEEELRSILGSRIDLPPLFLQLNIIAIPENEAGEFIASFSDENGIIDVTITTTPIDFETTPTFELTFLAQDSMGFRTRHVAVIEVIDVNEAPSIFYEVVYDGQFWTVTLDGTDPDGDDLSFEINGAPAQSAVFSVADIVNDLPLTLVAIDPDGLMAVASTSVPALTDLEGNDAPALLSVSQTSVRENENTTVTARWFDPEDGAFETEFTVPAQDFEGASSITLSLSATDSEGLEATFDQTISVIDVNERPIFSRFAGAHGGEDVPFGNPIWQVGFSDPEGSPVRLLAVTAGGGYSPFGFIQIGPSDYLITWANNEQGGRYRPTIIYTDEHHVVATVIPAEFTIDL